MLNFNLSREVITMKALKLFFVVSFVLGVMFFSGCAELNRGKNNYNEHVARRNAQIAEDNLRSSQNIDEIEKRHAATMDRLKDEN